MADLVDREPLSELLNKEKQMPITHYVIIAYCRLCLLKAISLIDTTKNSNATPNLLINIIFFQLIEVKQEKIDKSNGRLYSVLALK